MAGNMDASYIYLSYGKEKYMISVPCYFLFPVEHAHSNIYVIIVVKNYDYTFNFLIRL